MKKDKLSHFIKYDGEYLWLKVMQDDILVSLTKLGNIATHQGRITRVDKLRAVKDKNIWIRI